jgi:hypothetical protein
MQDCNIVNKVVVLIYLYISLVGFLRKIVTSVHGCEHEKFPLIIHSHEQRIRVTVHCRHNLWF